jgi:lysophospholipase L1-like esterase
MARSRSTDNSFPLGSHSRSRRRIALRQAAETQPAEVPADTLSIEIAAARELVEEFPEILLAVESEPLAPDAQSLPVESAEDAETTTGLASTEFAITATPSLSEELAAREAGERAVNFQPFKNLLKKTKPVTWLFTGDSITLGARHTEGRRNYSEIFAERVRWELRRSRDVIINTASAADTSRSLLSDLEWRSLRFQPDVVSVMIGINDAAAGRIRRTQFRKNLRHIAECIRAEGALPLFHTPPHVDVERVISHADLRSYVKCVREIAQELDVACIDHWARGAGRSERRPRRRLALVRRTASFGRRAPRAGDAALQAVRHLRYAQPDVRGHHAMISGATGGFARQCERWLSERKPGPESPVPSPESNAGCRGIGKEARSCSIDAYCGQSHFHFPTVKIAVSRARSRVRHPFVSFSTSASLSP